MRHRRLKQFLGVFLILSAQLLRGELATTNLLCGFETNPLGVDDARPRLSWQLQTTTPALRGQSQTAYQILVGSSAGKLAADQGDLWDSGKVRADSSLNIPYAGLELRSEQQVFWKARVWDQADRSSEWSPVATWSMGLLNAADWIGNWICASSTNPALPIFRREFAVQPGLQRAVISLCGLGQYELSANGMRVDQGLMAPGWSKYDRTCLYDTFDLTAYLTNGANAIGIMLGNGMYHVPASTRYAKFTGSYGAPKLIAQLHLFYTNGTSVVIGTDQQWLCNPGPITFSSVYGGEDHDARAEPAGWNRAGFNAGAWRPAAVTTGPGGILRGSSHAAPPIKPTQRLQPIRTNTIFSQKVVYDLGQNAALIPRLTTHGPAGSRVRITPSELTNSDGTVNRTTTGEGSAYWQYTLSGAETETWFPRFFYHGCRYLQVERFAAPGSGQLPVVDDLQGVAIQSASAAVGDFTCSNELFNRIRALIRWAQRNNLVSLITDCPHRERLGWLEQYHLHGPSLRYEFDLARLYAKTMDDMKDSQLTSGLVPDIAPEFTVFSGGFRDSPEWGSSAVLVPWQQYQFTGDDTLLRRYYETMTNYVAYLETKAVGYLLNYGLGDWYDLGPGPLGQAQLTPVALTATAYFYQDARILAETAKLLSREDAAAKFTALAENIRTSFNHSLFAASNGFYSTGSQTAQALPLVLRMVDVTNEPAVIATLVANVRSRGLTAGDIGHRYLLRALADAGRSDVVFDLHNRTNKPGYGYILNTGATALTEGWDGSNSQDHFMLGHIIEWFYHDLAGIQSDAAAPGFKRVIIKPALVGGISWVKASYQSARGAISNEWTFTNNTVALDLTLPIGATGLVYLPTLGTAMAKLRISESGIVIWRNGGPAGSANAVAFDHVEGAGPQTHIAWAVGAGSYHFSYSVLPASKATIGSPGSP